jgi:hypothetical protein
MLELAKDAMGVLLHERKFGVVRFQRKTLLICDHPVGLYLRTAGPHMGVGPLNTEEVWLPVDRRFAIVFSANWRPM